jgi:HK97 family phage portal protein
VGRLRNLLLGKQEPGSAVARREHPVDRILDPNIEERSYESYSLSSPPPPGWGWGGNESGQPVNEHSAMAHLAVYACVRTLSDIISTLPLDVYRLAPDGTRVNLPTPPVLTDPDTDVNQIECLSQVVSSLALRGNSYEIVTSRNRMEWPESRLPVHPDEMMVDRDDSGRRVYKINGERFAAADVIHIRRLTLAGAYDGLSPIGEAREAIGLGLAAQRYGAAIFRDSADPSAVLETDQSLDDPAMERIMRAWINSHGGRKYPAVTSGGLKYRRISITPEESQFLETRKFQRSEIAMFFGLPPHMIGDVERSTSWGSGIEQQARGFLTFNLVPWLRSIEEVYSKRLLPRGQYMRFNVEGLLRGDSAARAAFYTAARNAGWMNVDEIREKEDLPPVPGGKGKDYLQPMNMVPLGTPAPEPAPEPEDEAPAP